VTKVVACVKCIPEGRTHLEPGTLRLDRSGACEINPFDLFAVEEALRIKEAGDAEVIVVSMGPAHAAEGLRHALALGADRAVLVSDDGAAGADLLATARVLTAVLRRQEVDLVLFGQQAADGAGAVLWAAVAELLRVPVVSQATHLELLDGAIRVTRQTEFGDDVVEATTPAIVAVTDAVNEVRYSSLKGTMAAKKKPLEVLALADLGLDPDTGTAASGTDVRRVAEPPARPGARRIEDPEGAAEEIVAFLAERQLV
jgi:electron transfer flavoprotein beta subunit